MTESGNAIFKELFMAFDLDGNGVVGMNELHQVIQATKRVGTKAHHKIILRLEAEIQQAMQNAKKLGLSSPACLQHGTVTFAEGDGEPQLDPEAFSHLFSDLTRDFSEQDFEDFCTGIIQAVEDAKEHTAGNRFKKLSWIVFQLLDVNRDGHIDMTELEVMLGVSSKHDKKEVVKWKTFVAQKHGGPNDDNVRLTLADFQQFMNDFTGGNEDRLTQIAEVVQDEINSKNDKYLRTSKIDDIFATIKEDLVRERPHDVLAGIIKSVERLQRQGLFPAALARKRSVAALEATVNEMKGNHTPR